MKKILSFILVCLMLVPAVCVQTSAKAAKALPFELKAPENVYMDKTDGDSPTTMAISYSLSNDAGAFFQAKAGAEDGEAFLAPYGIEDVWLTVQIDWAIDDVDDPVSGWHYNEYWDYNENFGSFGYDDEGKFHGSAWDGVDCGGIGSSDTVNSIWILRGLNDFEWFSSPDWNAIPLKDQFKEGQAVFHQDDEGNCWITIDFTKHTVYARMRFAMTVRDSEKDTVTYSDWSSTVAYGKDAAAIKPITAKDLSAPKISDLHMTDEEFNGYPVVAFTLTVPDKLAELATKAAARGGGIYVETQARIKGRSEWVIMGNTDRDVRSGEMKCCLITLAEEGEEGVTKDVEIELRCRYWCSQPGRDDVYSGFSDIISFGATFVNPFRDIPEGKWFTKAVLYCYQHGYMSGTSGETFDPNAPFSRAMFVTVLSKLDRADTSSYTGTSFDDVKTGKWFSKPIQWAFTNGYAAGLGNGKFGPGESVTRQQMAQFLYNYSVKKGFKVDGLIDLSGYIDADKIAKWARSAMEWAVGNGLISGVTKSTLVPKGTATRAQVAVIVKNYAEKFIEA
ncbi:MAG: S-layer homology domain-containing protein [Clostridia bacterium]|nr:S-layer homology domain-containing protein [Clostridia bacterium]